MKYNRRCVYCGREYYVCNNCIAADSFSNLFCSYECFQKSLAKESQPHPIVINSKNKNVLIRGKLKSGELVNIIGYNLELGKYDCDDGTTKISDDFVTFYIPRSEMENIGKELKKINTLRIKGE